RRLAAGHKELAAKLAELERRVAGHDDAIPQLVGATRQLMAPATEQKPKRRIGFGRDQEQEPPRPNNPCHNPRPPPPGPPRAASGVPAGGPAPIPMRAAHASPEVPTPCERTSPLCCCLSSWVRSSPSCRRLARRTGRPSRTSRALTSASTASSRSS